MLIRCLLLGSALTLTGCNGYREIPLHDHVGEIEKTHTKDIQSVKTAFNGTINEEQAVKLALSFNPDIRIPIINNRGWGDREVQLRGIARPDLDLSQEEATLSLKVDVLSLYNLLSPSERAAWRQMRIAERKQAFSEQTGAVVRLKRDVRLAFLEVARLTKYTGILSRELESLNVYKTNVKNISNVTDVVFLLAESEVTEHIEENARELRNSILILTNLLGVDPDKELEFDLTDAFNITIMPEIKTIREMSAEVKENNWKLISLYSQYIRKEYDLRQAYLRRWGSITVGPSVTYNKEEEQTSAGASVRVKIPWPSRGADIIQDTLDERAVIAARYTAALHDLQSDVMRQYNEMQAKWKSINNPKVSVEWLTIIMSKETESLDVSDYIEVMSKLFKQERFQIDEVSKYKMSGIILESLLK